MLIHNKVLGTKQKSRPDIYFPGWGFHKDLNVNALSMETYRKNAADENALEFYKLLAKSFLYLFVCFSVGSINLIAKSVELSRQDGTHTSGVRSKSL